MRIVLSLFILTILSGPLAADWLQFRGTNSQLSDPNCNLPTQWSADGNNVSWKQELPGRGPSSPIVVGDQVIVTTASGPQQEQLHVMSFSATDGELQWRRNFWATGRTFTHPQSTPAAPTPASDGQHIYAFFSSNDLFCLDLAGNLLWFRGLGYEHPKAGNDVGMASSPVIVDDTVVVQIENQGDSFATGLDAMTGETRWLISRPERANWSSPIAYEPETGTPIVLLQGSDGVTAVQPKSGEIVWNIPGGASSISSGIPADGKAFIPSDGMMVLDLKDPSQKPEVVWQANRLNPNSMSPVLHDGKIYVINGAGVLNCADATTGELDWSLRLKGRFWSSPVVAGYKMYAINYDGHVFVVDLSGEKGNILAEFDLDEQVQATPALSDNAMFLKGEQHLWKVSSAN